MWDFGKMPTDWYPNLLNISAKNCATENMFTNLKSTIADFPSKSKHRPVAIKGWK